MKKRILSLALVVLTVFSLCASAFAAGEPEEETVEVVEEVAKTPKAEEAEESPSAEAESTDETKLVIAAADELTAVYLPQENFVDLITIGSDKVPTAFTQATSQQVPNVSASPVAEQPEIAVYRGGNDEPMCTSAYGYCGPNLKWYYYSSLNELEISGTGAMYDYGPGTAPWYSYSSSIKTIQIGSGVTSIGDYAFYGFKNLSSFQSSTSSSLTSIGKMAFFGGLVPLSSMTVPNTVTHLDETALAGIPTRAFKVTSGTAASRYFTVQDGVLYNASMTELLQYPPFKTSSSFTVPSTVSKIDTYSFFSCPGLEDVQLPSGLKMVNSEAFYACTLTKITIQSTDCTIADPYSSSSGYGKTIGVPGSTTVYAYSGSTAETYAKKHGYTFISLGDSGITPTPTPDSEGTVVSYGNCGIQGDNLTWTLMDNGVLTISGTGAMKEYSYGNAPWGTYKLRDMITSIVVKSGVTTIGSAAFYRCSNVAGVTLPDSLTSIGASAFRYCSNLADITLPSKVSFIGSYAFEDCISLGSIVIPNGVTTIEYSTFEGCRNLLSVTIPDSVISIDNYAFSDCQNLTSVDIPESVTVINYKAFSGCTRLTTITIHNASCDINTTFSDSLGTPNVTTIVGHANSTAQAYAEKHGYTFQKLPPKNGLITEGGKTYVYVDGEKQYGLVTVGSKDYYCSVKDGHVMKGGWANAGGGRYYWCNADDGHIMKGGRVYIDGKTYYLDKTGARQSGFITIGSLTYYFSPTDGHLMKGGLITVNGKQYYLSAKDGHMMKNGWVSIGNGRKVKLDANGVVIAKNW